MKQNRKNWQYVNLSLAVSEFDIIVTGKERYNEILHEMKGTFIFLRGQIKQ